jgi:hypothetical protein
MKKEKRKNKARRKQKKKVVSVVEQMKVVERNFCFVFHEKYF